MARRVALAGRAGDPAEGNRWAARLARGNDARGAGRGAGAADRHAAHGVRHAVARSRSSGRHLARCRHAGREDAHGPLPDGRGRAGAAGCGQGADRAADRPAAGREFPLHAPRQGAGPHRGAGDRRLLGDGNRPRHERLDIHRPRDREHALGHGQRRDRSDRCAQGSAAWRRARTRARYAQGHQVRGSSGELGAQRVSGGPAHHGIRAPRVQGA